MSALPRLRAALYHRVSMREQNPRLDRIELRAAAAARKPPRRAACAPVGPHARLA